MSIYLLLICAMALLGSKVYVREFHEDYLSKESSQSIKGIFILLILASHFSQYVTPYTALLDLAYWRIRVALGQGVVTYFLFCSGYGIAASIAGSGREYIRRMPARRLLPTLLIYDCSELLFLILQIWQGKTYSITHFIQSILAWKSFGNDNWYIFVVLCLYILSLLIFRKGEITVAEALQLTTATVGLALFLLCAGQGRYWYNTLVCFPLGVWNWLYKGKIDLFMSKGLWYFAPTFLGVLVCYILAHKVWDVNLLLYWLTMLLFVLCIVLASMKIKLCNPFLAYCGRHLQGLFLLHRIPMILLKPYFSGEGNTAKYIYFSLCLAATFFLEILFSTWITSMRGHTKLKEVDQ